VNRAPFAIWSNRASLPPYTLVKRNHESIGSMKKRQHILMRSPGVRYAQCVVRNRCDVPIKLELAAAQHKKFGEQLRKAGACVTVLPPLDDYPDSVFIEDAAIVLEESVVICPFAEPARAGEESHLAQSISQWREVRYLEPPAVIDGGDCIVAGKLVFVGISTRTNCAAYNRLKESFPTFEFTPVKVDVNKLLHLKTGATYIGDNKMVVAPNLVDPNNFPGFEIIEVPRNEEVAANCVVLNSTVFIPAHCPGTAQRIARAGFEVEEVDISEFIKGDGSLTCLCLSI
jgi:dimethylargininase